MKYFLSLGSNLGDKEKNIARAIDLLQGEGVQILKVSSLYKTEPVDYRSQPWFYNCLVEAQAEVEPEALLALTKGVEREMGRESRKDKGQRIIDIDILLAGDTIIHSEELHIPHPRMEMRNFVLIPFVEISPETVHPVLKSDMKQLLERSDDRSLVIRLNKHKEVN